MDKPTLPVRMDRILYDRLKRAAENDSRSMSNWVKIAIEKEIKRHEAAQTQPNDFADNVVG